MYNRYMFKLIVLILSITLSVDAQCVYTPKANIHIPNAFSPNNDGINDVLYVLGDDNCCEFTMKIFDRWGEKLFETNNINNGWDGTYRGKLLDVGVYAYFIVYECSNKIEEGSITLIR